MLDEETSTFFASDAKCFQLSVKLFSHPFFYVTHNSTKQYNVTYVLGRKKLLFLDYKCVGRTIVHPAAHPRISSRLLASLEALLSFAVSTRYESHVLSIGFAKWRGQFPLSNCSLSSCEKNTKSAEELIIINYFSRSFQIRRLYSPQMLTRKPRFRALCNQYRCTVCSTVFTSIKLACLSQVQTLKDGYRLKILKNKNKNKKTNKRT